MHTIITSRQNQKIKDIIKLRRRRKRQQTGLMLIEGHTELALALASGIRPRQLFYCPDLLGPEADTLLPQASQASTETYQVSRPVFEKISYRDTPDGWLAVTALPTRQLDDLTLNHPALLVVAETVEKPGNLGAILRSIDAAGGHGLLMCDPTTDLTNPNLIYASRGTCFTVPVVEADSHTAIDWLQKHQIAIIATTPDAEQHYTEIDLRRPLAIVVGTESTGLTNTWLQAATQTTRIPMRGQVNSLNVSIATALMLFEALRQRDHANV